MAAILNIVKKNRSAVALLKALLLCSCIVISGYSKVKTRKFDITFQLNNIQSFVPSHQLAIWLEREDSSIVKTLFLSEYLSYGGYNIPSICGEWSSKTNWSEVTQEEFDAVTSATPGVGIVKLKLESAADMIPDGKYRIFIEVHLAEEYNELYSSEIIFSGKKAKNILQVSYIPGKYPKKTEGDLLSDVTVICK